MNVLATHVKMVERVKMELMTLLAIATQDGKAKSVKKVRIDSISYSIM